MKLSDLKAGETAIISKISDNSLSLKLMEMGCIPGEKVKVNTIFPFNGPISISVLGYALALRRNEAACIEVN